MLQLKPEHQEECSHFSFTPFFKDGCEHEKESYVCSFIEQTRKNEHGHSILESGQKYDFYLYEDRDGKYICLRDGDKCSDYLSSGHVYDFMLLHEDQAFLYGDKYSVVAWILKNYGHFTFNWGEAKE